MSKPSKRGRGILVGRGGKNTIEALFLHPNSKKVKPGAGEESQELKQLRWKSSFTSRSFSTGRRRELHKVKDPARVGNRCQERLEA